MLDPHRRLSLFDATCVMVGIVVGSGIFVAPADIAKNTGTLSLTLLVWLAGGLASLLGALCFAELASRYPEHGGTYAFLTRAFGPRLGFFFAWVDFWIVRPSNLGIVAITLAVYAQGLWPLGTYGPLWYALASVLLATLSHVGGIHAGRWSQNALVVAKMAGLLFVIVVAFTLPPQASAATAVESSTSISMSGLAQAFVIVMFCYGGWSDLSYVAAEVRSPERNMLRALVLGVAVITVMYVLANFAFARALGVENLARSPTFAADLMKMRLGEAGRQGVSWLVIVACFSSLSSMTFTGARVYHALGLRHAWLRWMSHWDSARGTPTTALIAQAALCGVLLLFTAQSPDRFERLVILNSPCYWGFMLLVIVALMRLRGSEKTTTHFRVPLYPWLPIAFAAICVGIILSSLNYVAQNLALDAAYGAVVIGIGVALAWWIKGA